MRNGPGSFATKRKFSDHFQSLIWTKASHPPSREKKKYICRIWQNLTRLMCRLTRKVLKDDSRQFTTTAHDDVDKIRQQSRYPGSHSLLQFSFFANGKFSIADLALDDSGSANVSSSFSPRFATREYWWALPCLLRMRTKSFSWFSCVS